MGRLNGVGAAIAALAIGLLLVAGCGSDGDSPEDVALGFTEAAQEEDWEGVCGYLSEDSITAIEEAGEDCPATFEAFPTDDIPQGDVEVGEVTEDGDTATVEVTADGESDELPLIKDGDDWTVDLNAAG